MHAFTLHICIKQGNICCHVFEFQVCWCSREFGVLLWADLEAGKIQSGEKNDLASDNFTAS